MRITEVLATKGTDVVSVPPDCDVAGLLAVLAERGIGAAVVSADGATVEGIVSERDVVRALARAVLRSCRSRWGRSARSTSTRSGRTPPWTS
jgi:CBS domain-containing protein